MSQRTNLGDDWCPDTQAVTCLDATIGAASAHVYEAAKGARHFLGSMWHNAVCVMGECSCKVSHESGVIITLVLYTETTGDYNTKSCSNEFLVNLMLGKTPSLDAEPATLSSVLRHYQSLVLLSSHYQANTL
jgi:hypothetical protein